MEGLLQDLANLVRAIGPVTLMVVLFVLPFVAVGVVMSRPNMSSGGRAGTVGACVVIGLVGLGLFFYSLSSTTSHADTSTEETSADGEAPPAEH